MVTVFISRSAYSSLRRKCMLCKFDVFRMLFYLAVYSVFLFCQVLVAMQYMYFVQCIICQIMNVCNYKVYRKDKWDI